MARYLYEQGKNVHLIEKNRHVGGRLATKRRGKSEDTVQHFNFGLSSFSAKEILSSTLFELLIDEKLIEWADDENLFILQTPALHLIQFLLKGIPLSIGENVKTVQTSNGRWDLITERGNLFRGSELILSAPASQSLALINQADAKEVIETLTPIEYEKSLIFFADCDLDTAEKIQESFSPLFRRIQYKTRKPVTTLMLELNQELCDKYFELAPEEIAKEVQALLPELELTNPENEKWPCARVKNPIETAAFLQFSEKPSGYLIGDYFGSPEKSDFERAWLSAESLFKTLKR